MSDPTIIHIEKMIAVFYELSEVLYNADPANTMCNENGMADEYDAEAKMIVQDYVANKSMTKEEVHKIFEEEFSGYYDHYAIDKIYPTIKRIVYSSDLI